MPWTDDDQAWAEAVIRDGLDDRAADGRPVDDDPRVIAAMGPENVGNRLHPKGPPLSGSRLRRKLVSGRYGRWSTVVWRANLAAQVARSKARTDAIREGRYLATPNRAQRRAAAKIRRQGDR